MNTNKIAQEYRLSHWAGIMRERDESGLSIRAFCKKAGFHENIYFYWQRKLREAVSAGLTGVRNETKLASVSFAEVKVTERTMLAPSTATEQTQISIEAPGVRITAGSEYPECKLAALLREVMRPC